MRLFFALGFMFPLAAGASPAVVASATAPRPAAKAFTSSSASSRPLGGVALPTFPSTGTVRRAKRSTAAPRYIGPVYYIPNAFDAGYYDQGPPQEGPPDPPRRAATGQFFAPVEPPRTPMASEEQINPGDPIGPVENYYLIAYKDHTIYSALAYWVEGETLHYVTMQNKHNQASIGFIDIEQTTKLNSDRAVPFSLSGN